MTAQRISCFLVQAAYSALDRPDHEQSWPTIAEAVASAKFLWNSKVPVMVRVREYSPDPAKLPKTIWANGKALASLFLVCDDMQMGDNSDLFVRAFTLGEAVQGWRDYYELPATAQPERIIEVPDSKGDLGAVNWDTIAQHKREG